GEGSRFFHGDRHGRSFYLPPNSASNATWLLILRHLLIQDWDTDADGRPDTLRLLDAVPPRWLADGTVIDVARAPSAFGDVAFRVEAPLGRGEVRGAGQAPPRRRGGWLLRVPDPPGHAVESVRVGDEALPRAADGRVDLTGRDGRFTVSCRVRPAR